MAGLIGESYGFTDWCARAILGEPKVGEIKPLERDAHRAPFLYQGDTEDCVSCAVSWIVEWFSNDGVALDWKTLALHSGTGANGASPSKVLERARKSGILPDKSKYKVQAWARLWDKSPDSLYHALASGCLLCVGVKDWGGRGPHMLAGYDVSDDGKRLKCVNWWNSEGWDIVELEFAGIETAIAVFPERPTFFKTMPLLQVIKSKLPSVIPFVKKEWKLFGTAALLLVALGIGSSFAGSAAYGASGVATSYSTAIAGSGISSSDASIPVSSVTLSTGEKITTATIEFPSYFVINKQELVECNGLDTTGANPTWTWCYRGLSFLGGATSTVSGLAKAHSAGESFAMTNAAPYYNRFATWHSPVGKLVMPTGQSLIWDGIHAGWTDDGVSTYSFASGTSGGLSASSTSGIFLLSSKIGIRLGNSGLATTGTGLYFDSSGNLAAYVSSTYFTVDSNGAIIPATTFPYFSSSAYFGDGSDGDVTMSSTTGYYVLTHDMNYNSLNIQAGATLTASNYRIYVKNTLTVNGAIASTGTDAVTTATTTNSTLGSLGHSADGGVGGGCNSSGHQGNPGSTMYAILGGYGGGGGASSGGGYPGGATNTGVAALSTPSSTWRIDSFLDTQETTYRYHAGAPGGGGGCNSGGYTAQGGSGATGGGFVWISASTLSGAGNFSVNGGKGSNATINPTDGSAGGGGGGGGGVIFERYHIRNFTGSEYVSGGLGGTCAHIGGGSPNCTDGGAGAPGRIYKFSI